MRKISCLWRYLRHRKYFNNGLDLVSRKQCLSTSQINGNKQDLVQPIFSPTKWEIHQAEQLFHSIGPKAILDVSGVKLTTFTKLQRTPEVALLGRTSVGKSSLINALLHQKKLAKTSKMPGHTRLINYFNVGSKFYLVDLPGYGYVEGQGHGSQNFVNIVEKYLKARAGKKLRSVCLLIDGKVGIKNNDLIAVEMLEEMNTSFHVVLTKMDRVKKDARDLISRQINHEIQKLSTLCFPHFFPVSSKDKTGLSDLRCFIGLCTGILK